LVHRESYSIKGWYAIASLAPESETLSSGDQLRVSNSQLKRYFKEKKEMGDAVDPTCINKETY